MKGINRRITTLVLATMSAGGIGASRSLPADSVVSSLEEVTVNAVGRRPLFRIATDGTVSMSAVTLEEMPSLLGSRDPIAALRSLPAVATSNEMQASVNVRGASTGANRFATDGMRIINPLHITGLYSSYNPSFYRTFRFRADRVPASAPNCTGGIFDAFSSEGVDTLAGGEVAFGLIESHGAIRLPLKKGISSISLGARRSYLNLLFPDVLTFDDSKLKYGFTDLNLSFRWQPGERDLVCIDAFGSSDDMNMNASGSGVIDGTLGWKNFSTGVRWLHANLDIDVSHTVFSNHFQLSEAGRNLRLPSRFSETSARASLPLGDFRLAADITRRHSSGQKSASSEAGGEPAGRGDGWEWNVGADWRRIIRQRLTLTATLKLAIYHSEGYTAAIPLPRFSAAWRFSDAATARVAYDRLAQFDILVQETTAGLPADFMTNSTRSHPAARTHSITAGCNGMIPTTGIAYNVDAYLRLTDNAMEYCGSLLDLVNSGYNPLSDLMSGENISYGMSVSLMKQWGRLRGRAGYNLGKSRSRFAKYGDRYYPSAHDRLHDLNATLTWEPTDRLTFSASFTHATGLPFTRAKYGYMIGENLICEYESHNTSRLPAYNRLDLSAGYIFRGGHGMRHAINISVYNATAARNVLFYYTSYSSDEGIKQRESTMKNVIPSLIYTLTF